MNQTIDFLLLVLCTILLTGLIEGSNEAFITKLKSAMTVANSSIDGIYKEWSINEYPLFLKSCFMHKSSWEIMKFKLMGRIISAFELKTKKSFVISFLGRFIPLPTLQQLNEGILLF